MTESTAKPVVPGLDEQHPDAAYHAGRIVAVLQHVHDVSWRKIKGTYAKRFYSGASTMPGIIIPRIFSSARHRLDKVKPKSLREELSATLARAHDAIAGEIPNYLPLARQGAFQLGFFHQTACLPRRGLRDRIKTKCGESVKSGGEKLIADLLYNMGVDYQYEQPLGEGEGEIRPDFTIQDEATGRILYIEYLGMLGNEKYERSWDWKRRHYEKVVQAKGTGDVETDGTPAEKNIMPIEPHELMSYRLIREQITTTLIAVFGRVPRKSDESNAESPF